MLDFAYEIANQINPDVDQFYGKPYAVFPVFTEDTLLFIVIERNKAKAALESKEILIVAKAATAILKFKIDVIDEKNTKKIKVSIAYLEEVKSILKALIDIRK